MNKNKTVENHETVIKIKLEFKEDSLWRKKVCLNNVQLIVGLCMISVKNSY